MIDINKLIYKYEPLIATGHENIDENGIKQLLKECTQLLLQKAADKATIGKECGRNSEHGCINNCQFCSDAVNPTSITSIINDINFD